MRYKKIIIFLCCFSCFFFGFVFFNLPREKLMLKMKTIRPLILITGTLLFE